MRLSRPEIDVAVLLLRTSLAALHRAFPNSELIVAYLPSPLSSYRLVSETVTIKSGQQPWLYFPAVEVARRSNMLCRMVRASAIDVGARFFDTRPAMRAAGESRFIHGPKDWQHYNREGNTALGQAVYDFLLAEGAGDSSCAVL